MFSSSKIALALSFLAVASASPLARLARRSGSYYSGSYGSSNTPYLYTPQINNDNLEIVGDNGLELVPGANDGDATLSQPVAGNAQIQAKYYPEQGVFLLVPVADPDNKALAQANNDLVTADQNPNDPTQQFAIVCLAVADEANQNGDVPGLGCPIFSVSAQQCLAIGGNPGDAATFEDCNSSTNEPFSFVVRDA